jgi:hypothetical protein
MFTFNSRSFPGTAPLICRLGDRVRVRLANLNMTSHPIHIHGVRVWVVETDGGQIPETAWWPETTVNVIPGTTRAVEFVADVPGDWAFHCHKPHHAMNAMGHDIPNVLGVDQSGVEEKIRALVPGYMAMGKDGMAEHAQHAEHMKGLPNTLPMMTGTGPFGPIEMGGMFTVVKVRENPRTDEDPAGIMPKVRPSNRAGGRKPPDEKDAPMTRLKKVAVGVVAVAALVGLCNPPAIISAASAKDKPAIEANLAGFETAGDASATRRPNPVPHPRPGQCPRAFRRPLRFVSRQRRPGKTSISRNLCPKSDMTLPATQTFGWRNLRHHWRIRLTGMPAGKWTRNHEGKLGTRPPDRHFRITPEELSEMAALNPVPRRVRTGTGHGCLL